MTQRNETWKIDKHVNIAFIAAFLTQCFVLGWYIAKMDSRIEVAEVSLSKNEDEAATDRIMLANHALRLQKVEDHQFTSEDAEKLSEKIIKEMRYIFQPMVSQVERNTNTIQEMQSKIK